MATATFGKTTIGASSGNAGANAEYVSQFTMGASGLTIDRGALYVQGASATAKVKMVIYADSGSDTPGALVATSSEVVGVGAGRWVWFAFPSPPALTASAKYWLGYHTDTSFSVATATAGTNYWLTGRAYTSGPLDPWSGGTSATAQLSILVQQSAGVDVSKAHGYAVLSPPADRVNVSKALGYAVLESTRPGVSVSKALAYAVVEEVPALAVTDVSPPAEVEGTPVTITGTGFAAGATVTFGGVAASDVVVVSPTSITCTAPPHALGAVDVTVTVGVDFATLAAGYTYLDPYRIDSVVPATAHTSGGSATVAGDGFETVIEVRVGGSLAAFGYVDGEHLSVTIPAGTAGATTLEVRDLDGVTRSIAFEYVASSLVSVTSPARVGDTVTVTGVALLPAAIVLVDGVPAPTTWVSSTTLSAIVPGVAPGTYDLDVDNSAPGYFETLTLAAALEILAPLPVLTSNPIVLYVVS